jgi:hypothetical protein
LLQAGQDIEGLLVGQSRCPPGVGPGAKAVSALSTVGGDPAADGTLGDTQEGGHVTLDPALEDALDGEAATLF